MADVLAEAKAIRDALLRLGWRYMGGGPYPHNPKMRFECDTRGRIDVEITPTQTEEIE